MKVILKISLALLTICMSVALLLSVVNEVTKPIIERAEKEQKQQALASLFPSLSEISTSKIDCDFREYSEFIVEFYSVSGGDSVDGYYAQVRTYGFKSNIELLVGIDKNGEVCGVEILSHNETVGIGTKIEERSFLDIFLGKNGSIQYKKGGGDDGEIDGISSATYSSKAVIEAVSYALNAYKIATEK